MWGSRDPFLEFWEPLISRGRLKLKTSNLAQRWIAVSTNEKCKIRPKVVVRGSRDGDPLLEFWDPPNISGTAKAGNFKFLTQRWMAVRTNEKNAKLGQKG